VIVGVAGPRNGFEKKDEYECYIGRKRGRSVRNLPNMEATLDGGHESCLPLVVGFALRWVLLVQKKICEKNN
jgi:hypothetical protein